MKTLKISRMKANDIELVAKVHRNCFPRDTKNLEGAIEWIRCNYKAFPRMQYFVAKNDDGILGYLLCSHLGGGWRKTSSIMQLEHIGVHQDYRGKRIGTQLIDNSLELLEIYLHERDLFIAKTIVLTRISNEAAQRLYTTTLGAIPVSKIPNLYSEDAEELVMLATRAESNEVRKKRGLLTLDEIVQNLRNHSS